MASGERIRTHNVVRVRMTVTVMGTKTRTLVDACRSCCHVGDYVTRFVCRPKGSAAWADWLRAHEGEEITA